MTVVRVREIGGVLHIRCAKCRKFKPRDQHYGSRKNKHGVSGYCIECTRNVDRIRFYKLTEDEYRNLLKAQGGKCAICLKGFRKIGKLPRVDHCHETGAVRGLLCHGCNHGIGMFGDDPQRMDNAAAYLRRTHAGKKRRGTR